MDIQTLSIDVDDDDDDDECVCLFVFLFFQHVEEVEEGWRYCRIL